jgi:hypothetical protein
MDPLANRAPAGMNKTPDECVEACAQRVEVQVVLAFGRPRITAEGSIRDQRILSNAQIGGDA